MDNFKSLPLTWQQTGKKKNEQNFSGCKEMFVAPWLQLMPFHLSMLWDFGYSYVWCKKFDSIYFTTVLVEVLLWLFHPIIIATSGTNNVCLSFDFMKKGSYLI